MPTSMESHAQALEKAQAWLREHQPEVRRHEPGGVHVDAHDHQAGERWRCELAVPHPADPTMVITATASGIGREGSMELALMELRGFLMRCWQNPQAEVHRLLEQREQMPYEPSPQSIDRAMRCLRDRQVLDVGDRTVGAVGARMAATSRGLPLTVGDVVRQVLTEAEQAEQMRLGA